MICQRCQKEIPTKFLAQFFTGGEYYLLDPQCALEFKNDVHGTSHKKFTGQAAQQMLEDFREWKNK